MMSKHVGKAVSLTLLLGFSWGAGAATESTTAMENPEVCRNMDEPITATDLTKIFTPEIAPVFQRTATLDDALKQELGSEFGGTWLEYDADRTAHRVVGVTTLKHRSSSTIAANPDVVLVHVKYSLDQLTAALNAINSRYVLNVTGTPWATTTMIDLKNKRVVSGAEKADMGAMKKALEADGYDMNMLHVEYIKRPVAVSH